MKCDYCRHQKFDPEDNQINCLMGHWFGMGEPDAIEDQTLWDNCEDFDKQEIQEFDNHDWDLEYQHFEIEE